MSDGYVTIKADLNTKSFDAQIEDVEYQLKQLDYELSHAKELKLDSKTVDEYRSKAEKLTNQLVMLIKKQDEINRQGFNNAINSIGQIGSSVESVIKKVSKWALAVFSVRSAYLFVRQSVSTLSQYDEQMATNIEWIRYLLASALKPIIETIINLAYKLLVYIGYIAKAWFGVNIFANASAKAFKKVNSGIRGANKSAKELQKTLAGFDEMNILQKDGSTATGGGGGGISLPDMSKINIPDWVDKISKLPEKLKDIWKNTIEFWENDWEEFFKDNGTNWGLFIEGIGDKLHGFYSILKGFGEIIIAIFDIIYGAIIGDFDKIGKGFEVLWDGAKNVFNGFYQWFEGTWKILVGFVQGIFSTLFGKLGQLMLNPVKATITTITSLFKNWYTSVQKIVDGIILIFKGNFRNGIEKAFSGLKGILLAPINALISGINVLIKGVNKIHFDVPKWVPGFGGKKWGFNLPTIPKLAKGGIINMPGRGVPLAYGGEAGKEAVVPLTDSQQMALLGEAIGKYININATVPVYVGNRQIAKEIKKINAESDFAYNR